MTQKLTELLVDTEVCVSPLGLKHIKSWHEELVEYCYTSKVIIVSEGNYWDKDDSGATVIYDCKFVDDPEETPIELTDKELSLISLHYFNIPEVDFKKEYEALFTDVQGEQLELEIKNDEFVVPTFEQYGKELGALVDLKQKAYGNAIEQTFNVIEVFLKPYETTEGYVIPKSLLRHLLLQVRIIDKQNRIFNNPNGDLMQESPYGDIAGYGLLGKNMANIK